MTAIFRKYFVVRYAEHVASAEEDSVAALDAPSHVVMLTNDADNKKRAAAEGVNASTMREYVTEILKIPELEVRHFPLSGSISTVLTGLSWIRVGIHSRRALLNPVCA